MAGTELHSWPYFYSFFKSCTRELREKKKGTNLFFFFSFLFSEKCKAHQPPTKIARTNLNKAELESLLQFSRVLMIIIQMFFLLLFFLWLILNGTTDEFGRKSQSLFGGDLKKGQAR
jgi:hypothetical protein